MQGSKISIEIFRTVFFQITDMENWNSEKICAKTHMKYFFLKG